MPKPIGNQAATLKRNDKVSRKLKAKFSPQSGLQPDKTAPKPAEPARKPAPKYKTRKK